MEKQSNGESKGLERIVESGKKPTEASKSSFSKAREKEKKGRQVEGLCLTLLCVCVCVLRGRRFECRKEEKEIKTKGGGANKKTLD